MAVPVALKSEEIREALGQLKGWSGDENGLERTLSFQDFPGAIAFMHHCTRGSRSSTTIRYGLTSSILYTYISTPLTSVIRSPSVMSSSLSILTVYSNKRVKSSGMLTNHKGWARSCLMKRRPRKRGRHSARAFCPAWDNTSEPN